MIAKVIETKAGWTVEGEHKHGPFPTPAEAMSATPYFDYLIIRAQAQEATTTTPTA